MSEDLQVLANSASALSESLSKTFKEMRDIFDDQSNTISSQSGIIASLQSEVAELRELCATNIIKNPQAVRDFLDNNTKLLAEAIFEVACGRIPGSKFQEEVAQLREALQRVQHEADFSFNTFHGGN